MTSHAEEGFERIFDSGIGRDFIFTSLELLLTKGPMTHDEIFGIIFKNPELKSLRAYNYMLPFPFSYITEKHKDGKIHITKEGKQLYKIFETIGKLHEIK